MAVKIGSARIDERGKISGGKAGDQTGNEVSTQNWYKHSKGWRVFRPNDVRQAEKIAFCMELACKSKYIGYDQNQRNTLYSTLKNDGFDISKLGKNVETDCSALVRFCCAYAGIQMSDFNTSSEANALLKSGAFKELKDKKYTTKSNYLRRGDVLVTKTKGHTVVVLSNGPDAEDWGSMPPSIAHNLGDRILKNGMEGDDVKELQSRLIELGYSCGSYGADGEYGDATEMAVRKFQIDHKCEADGEFGPETYKALIEALGDDTNEGYHIKIVGGNCYVHPVPDKESPRYGVAREGEIYPYGCVQSEDGWYLIEYKAENAWISGKYGRIV